MAFYDDRTFGDIDSEMMVKLYFVSLDSSWLRRGVFYHSLPIPVYLTASCFAPILGTGLVLLGTASAFFLVSYAMIYYAMLHIIHLKQPFMFLQNTILNCRAWFFQCTVLSSDYVKGHKLIHHLN